MNMLDFNIAELDADRLAELVAYHNRRYWELGEPEISDVRYDELIRALRRLAPEHPLLSQVSAPVVAGNGKVHHAEPMLSLDKAYSLDEVLAWAEKFARTPGEMLLVQPKYDGISAKFDGRVLSTRGDGEYGEDVSDKLPLIELESPGYTGPCDRPARGELVIRDDDFATIYSHVRKKDGALYKNSRNAVAGIMGLKEIADMVHQGAKLTLADYTLVSFPVPLSALAERWDALLAKLAALPYPQDGVVLKFADAAFRESLGNTVHHPRGEIAYKFTNRKSSTRLVGVEWSFGKNCLTPVALLDPVEISGTTIRRATLHNLQNVLELGVMIGDSVVVERAGDVIPHIVSCAPGETRQSPLIDRCPECAAQLERRGPELVCPNPECPGTRLQRLCAAVRNLGIERLGEPTVRKLVNVCGVRHLRDLFELKKEDVLRIGGFAEKSAANLIEEIAKARVVNDYQLLAALNIPNVGPNVAKQLLSGFTLAELRRMDETKLAEQPGIGPERAHALCSELAAQSDFLDEMLVAVRLIPTSGSPAEQLPGICFTGKMPEKRSFYENLARQAGYAPADEVTKNLALLVADDPAGNSTKLRNARKFGVRIVSLDGFLAELGRTSGAAAPSQRDEIVQDELF